MSAAHRPTWNPAQGKEITELCFTPGVYAPVKSGSSQLATFIASQTKLKFRQPGQTSTTDVQKRVLRAELLKAKQEARERKRKAVGGAFIVGSDAPIAEIEDRNPKKSS